MKLILGCDHSGYQLKQAVIEHLQQYRDYEIEDVGAYSSDASDYPDFVKKLCQKVLRGKDIYGIFFCGTGIGPSIAANRILGIRATHCGNTYEARMAKEHNNGNVLCIGERVLGTQLALEIVEMWLKSKFTYEERHVRRLEKIETMNDW